MISIIISSYQKQFFDALVQNIEDTCGITYEIIKIDNPGLMGISEAYNKGAQKAQYPYLVFCHEDILFHTQNWGEKLIKHLQQKDVGVVGTVGSDYVPVAPCGWHVGSMKHQFLHLIQNTKNGNQPEHNKYFSENRHLVYALDGVFLATTKKVYQEFKFNEDVKGFHSYDLDFSLRIAKKYKNYVVSDILIEHFSLGSPDQTWFENNIQIRKNVGSNFHKKKDNIIERKLFISFLALYFKYYGISIKNMFKTFYFLPFGRINLKDYSAIAKSYYYYFRYKKSYTAKFKNTI